MSVKVKICGVTNEQDAQWAANLGADFIGLNFWSGSPRKVSVDMGAGIVAKLPPFVVPVGVFVDNPPEEIAKTVKKTGVKGVQLHGEQSPAEVAALAQALGPSVFIMKAFRVSAPEHLNAAADYKPHCKYFLIDARVEGEAGGTGQTFPWELAAAAKAHGLPVFVAGGLTPNNAEEAVEKTQPFGLDTASGVEKTPKRKDYDKMKAFIERAKNA